MKKLGQKQRDGTDGAHVQKRRDGAASRVFGKDLGQMEHPARRHLVGESKRMALRPASVWLNALSVS